MTPLPKTSNPATDSVKHYLNITTLEQLAEHTEKEIANLHGVGPKAVRIWKEEMAKIGLSFKKEQK